MELILKNVFKGHIGWTAVDAVTYYPGFPLRVENLFPQLLEVNRQFPIVSPLEEVTRLKRVSPAAYSLSRETCMLLLVIASL